ncbi:glycerate kinase [Oceanobacillus manasiensis]|uniref:glycerate kinase n=1 Tax=Oceanobacillus manasiensis TaxID=586413 RepID=UPI0005A7E853|nr:glycerate kinase [Oceanobacillus manasiensis]
MNILIAIDSFKGSISSVKGSEAISLGVRDIFQEATIFTFPLADGGEGTVESIVQATSGDILEKNVTGPLNEKVSAKYGLSGNGKTAIIEVATVCGLPLIPPEKLNPLKATTYGVGELISHAMDEGCRDFIIGLGGSATNDAGIGMLQALGFRFLDAQGQEVGLGGQALLDIQKINTDHVNPHLKQCTFRIACDVNNFLHGESGAAHVFGPQKGATQEMIKELDNGLKHFSEVVLRDLGIDIQYIEGAGAAGGLGAAFLGFLHADLQSGVDTILEANNISDYISKADFVITGEGKFDRQTSMGKAPIGVAKLAKEHGIPVIGLAGSINTEEYILNNEGITTCYSILNAPMSLKEAMEEETAFQNLRFTVNQIFRLIKSLKQ